MSDAVFTHDAFVSRRAKDKAIVRAVAERPRVDGLRVWLDEWEICPGESIAAKIEDALEHSRVLACPAVASGRRRMLCMSAHAFGSDWPQLEAGTFRFRDPLNEECSFIPLRLDTAPVKGSLAQFLSINPHRKASEEYECEEWSMAGVCPSSRARSVLSGCACGII